ARERLFFSGGEQVGEVLQHIERLKLFLGRHHSFSSFSSVSASSSRSVSSASSSSPRSCNVSVSGWYSHSHSSPQSGHSIGSPPSARAAGDSSTSNSEAQLMSGQISS